jgi:glyoxalase family protein
MKRTVDFDDSGTYHFYFGDDTGTPGTILTFFPWPHASRGIMGVGEISATASSIPAESLDYWERRLLGTGLPFEREEERFERSVLKFIDLDGMKLELVGQIGGTGSNDVVSPTLNSRRCSHEP